MLKDWLKKLIELRKTVLRPAKITLLKLLKDGEDSFRIINVEKLGLVRTH